MTVCCEGDQAHRGRAERENYADRPLPTELNAQPRHQQDPYQSPYMHRKRHMTLARLDLVGGDSDADLLDQIRNPEAQIRRARNPDRAEEQSNESSSPPDRMRQQGFQRVLGVGCPSGSPCLRLLDPVSD